MTAEEIETEERYRRLERLGILCGEDPATPYALNQAAKDVREWHEQRIKNHAPECTTDVHETV